MTDSYDYTGCEEEYNPFEHLYPILICADGQFIEILMAFAVIRSDVTPPHAISLEPGDIKDAPVHEEVRFSLPDDIFSGEPPTVSKDTGYWILPAIVRARKLVGRPEDNIPGGDGGIPMSPVEFAGFMDNVDFSRMFTEFRDNLLGAPPKLVDIVNRFVAKYES